MPVLTITGEGGAERRVEWVDGCIGIGREPSNHVELEHARVARWHAAIFEEAGPSYRLRDLGSARGTLVAGKRIQSHLLREGDEIGVGPFRLVYAGDAGCTKATPGGHALHFRFGPAVNDPIGREVKEPTLSGQIGWESAAARADGSRPSPRALFEAIQSVAARLDLDELLECLLEQVDRLATPSVSFAALVRDDGSLDIRQRRSRLETEPGPKGVRVSQTVIHRTLESGKPILAFKRETSVSMSELGISRAIGLPLVAHGRVRGLIYGDWRRWGEPPQDEERMEWVAALAVHAGTAFENALHYQRLKS